MNISEQQAKEVIDFLIHKINPDARWIIEEWYGCFILKIKTFCFSNTIASYAKESNENLCSCTTRSCRDMLDVLVDRACKNDIVYGF